MADVVEIAEEILAQEGPMSARKLHELLYRCQGWALACTGRPLFEGPLEAVEAGVESPRIRMLLNGDIAVNPGALRERAKECPAFCKHLHMTEEQAAEMSAWLDEG